MLEEKSFGYGLHLLDDAFGRADPPVQEAQGSIRVGLPSGPYSASGRLNSLV